jgi:hypothetical protein
MQMKRFPFLQVAVMVALMVVVVGCSMPRSVAGGYYEDSEPTYRNGYYGNTYGGNVIVVERDPFTGRYYEVSPYGAPSRYYGNSYGNRSYDSRYYNNRNSRNNNSYYRGDNGQKRQAQEQQRRETTRQMESTKESILGQKKN